MVDHEKQAAAEVLSREIALTGAFFGTVSRTLVQLKQRIVARLTIGTEADAGLRADRKTVLHDITYPDVGAVRQS